ncbi:MAG: hypothetical protein E7500_09855 [Ruminococcus sp.]|nr:hypothetical protein [Ruminococcus sp.]
MDAIKNFFNNLLDSVPDILFAILLLIVAFIAAKIVKSIVMKLLNLIKLDKISAKTGINAETAESAKKFIAKLAYFVTFLLFLPGVLDKLGMSSVSGPISGLADDFISFIPKLVSAGIILAVGLFIAKILKDLLLPLLKATKIDALQAKTGIKVTEKTALSSIITNIVYGFVVLIALTSALDQLEITAISGPTNAIVSTIFAYIPDVLGTIVIIAIGVFVSNLVAGLLEGLLAGVGADTLIEKITGSNEKNVSLSKIISTIVKYVMVVIFIVQGVNVLGLSVLTNIGATIIAFVPTALVLALIVAGALFAGSFIEKAIAKKFPEAKATAFIVKMAVYVVAGFLCLSQLGIAKTIVESTFILIVAAVCVAFAIAFGVGGKAFAANRLAKLEKKIDSTDKAE